MESSKGFFRGSFIDLPIWGVSLHGGFSPHFTPQVLIIFSRKTQ